MVAKKTSDSIKTRLSLRVGKENKTLIRQAAKKDGRPMNQWATRALRDAALADLKK